MSSRGPSSARVLSVPTALFVLVVATLGLVSTGAQSAFAGGDVEPPSVTVFTPNGGESWLGGTSQEITWVATDNTGVTWIDIDYRTDPGETWKPVARQISNSGSFDWFVHHTPTVDGQVRVTAHDSSDNSGSDENDTDFSILQIMGGTAPTTLRDFHMPGSQPFDAGNFSSKDVCAGCHGGYDEAAEPSHGFGGSMMAYSMIDPLFLAAMTVSEQDAPSSGDLCLRCHTPFGWLGGRSNPTDGSELTGIDLEGVSCEYCHRMVDPVYVPGESPAEDEEVLLALENLPLSYSNGQYVVDPEARRRGPYDDASPPHAFLSAEYYQSSDFCGTCHDVSNPVYERVSGQDYALGTLDEEAAAINSEVLMPLERTYSEWKSSEFAVGSGVFAPEFAGNKPDGYVSACQDCHMADVEGRGALGAFGAPIRSDLGFHSLVGGSSWMLGVLADIRPDVVDADEASDGAERSVALLELSAHLDLQIEPDGSDFEATVTVTNRTGHKLPTGYPEGRRMWIHVIGEDEFGATVYESGGYDEATGVLTLDSDITVYEAKLGLSEDLASTLGLGAGGESFHFSINDSIYKDNRIPPQGFTNASFDLFGGVPVDSDWPGPGPRYPDGQNWDAQTYSLPSTTNLVRATLYYQSTSKEYIEFLRDENTTDSTGQDMYDAWSSHGKAAPVAMVADTLDFDVSDVPVQTPEAKLALFPETNPFRDLVVLRLDLPRPSEVRVEVYDSQGRRVHQENLGLKSAGPHRVEWDAQNEGRASSSGVYWFRVQAGSEELVQRVVRVR